MAQNRLEQIRRPRVDELMRTALEVPLTAVVAGAGFGKTEAVLQFLRGDGIPTAWVQISGIDNIPARFWENFARAVGKLDPEFAEHANATGFPESSRAYERFANAMADVAAGFSRFAIVFDDFHHIREPKILRFLQRDSASSIHNISRIFVSRETPAFFTSAHLLRHNAAYLSEDELRFTKEEMLAFFERQGVPLDPDAAETVFADTGGWIFAIQLVAIGLRQNPGLERRAISAMKANVARLLETEVFGILPERQQRALIKLSLVRNPDSSLVRRLSGGTELLGALGRGSAFIRYDEAHDTWRIHNIFREFLRERQGILTEDERRDAWRSAAEWSHGNNLLLDTVFYLEKLGDHGRLLDLTFNLDLSTPREVMEAIVDVLKRAPDSLYQSDARAYVLYTRLLMNLGRLEEAQGIITGLIERLADEPESEYRNTLLYSLNNTMGFIGMIECIHTGTYRFARYFKTADAHFSKCAAMLDAPGVSLAIGLFVNRVGRKHKGGFEKHIAELEAAQPYVSHYLGGCMGGLPELAKAELAYFRGDMDACAQYARVSADKARQDGQYEICSRALFFLLRRALYRGRQEEILTVLDDVKKQPLGSDHPGRYKLFETTLGWLYAQIGRPELIPHWIKREIAQENKADLRMGIELQIRVKHYLLTGQHQRLLSLLGHQGSPTGMGEFLIGRIELRMNEAICLYHLKEGNRALKVLKEAYDLAQPNGIITVFAESGNDIRALTEYAMKCSCRTLPSDWLENVHAKASTCAKRHAQAAQFILSPKEQQQLHLTKAEKEMLTMLS
ncbi:MAG: hypothetical protein LBD12_07185, partial [Clostridiales Family XIII bacterium]|nr:hypothetical protein [Clostridiales Family XIII bacterium]